MTDLTEKTTALDEQSAVENSEEITQTPSVWKEIFIQGVWKNNSTLVQLLGLCPLLAVSSTATNALGLGLATMLVLTCTNTVVSLFRKQILMKSVFRLCDDYRHHRNRGATIDECLYLYTLSSTWDFLFL